MREFEVRDLSGTSDTGRLSIAWKLKREMSSEIKSMSEKDNMTLTISSIKKCLGYQRE